MKTTSLALLGLAFLFSCLGSSSANGSPPSFEASKINNTNTDDPDEPARLEREAVAKQEALKAKIAALEKEFQDDKENYITLAEMLSSPIVMDIDQANKGCHSDVQVMLRMEIARQKLMNMKNFPYTDLAQIRNYALESLATCHMAMENLRQLDQYVPDIEGFAKKTLTATPGLYKNAMRRGNELTQDEKRANADLILKAGEELLGGLVNSYKASTERSQYQAAYNAIRRDARQQLFASAVIRHKKVPFAPAKTLSIVVDGSWNNTFSSDLVRLRNDSGKDLTNCTILVSLKGTTAVSDNPESDKHLHFLATWPAGKWAYARYPSRAASTIAQNESVDMIEEVNVTLLSDQLTCMSTYSYIGDDFDSDVERWVKSRVDSEPKPFSLPWSQANLVYNSGVALTFNCDLASIPVESITLKLVEGSRETTQTWSVAGKRLSSGWINKLQLYDESFNNWKPDSVSITLGFPKSAYKYTRSYTYTWK